MPRPIIAVFWDYKYRKDIFDRTKLLKGTDFVIRLPIWDPYGMRGIVAWNSQSQRTKYAHQIVCSAKLI